MTRYRAAIVGTGGIAAAHATGAAHRGDRPRAGRRRRRRHRARAAASPPSGTCPTSTRPRPPARARPARTWCTSAPRRLHAELALACLRAGAGCCARSRRRCRWPSSTRSPTPPGRPRAARGHRLPAPLRRRRRAGCGGCRRRRAGPAAAGHLRDHRGSATTPTSRCRGAAGGTPRAAGPPWATASTSSTCCCRCLGAWAEVTAVAGRRQARHVRDRGRVDGPGDVRHGAVASVVNSCSPRGRCPRCGSTSRTRRSSCPTCTATRTTTGRSRPRPGHEEARRRWAHGRRSNGEITDHAPQLAALPGRPRRGREPPVTIARHAADHGVRRRPLRLGLHRPAA